MCVCASTHLADGVDFAAQVDAHANDGAQSGVHALSVAAAREHGKRASLVLVLGHRFALDALDDHEALGASGASTYGRRRSHADKLAQPLRSIQILVRVK